MSHLNASEPRALEQERARLFDGIGIDASMLEDVVSVRQVFAASWPPRRLITPIQD